MLISTFRLCAALVAITLYRRHRIPTRVVAALSALVALFFVIGLGRSQFGGLIARNPCRLVY